MKTSLPHPIHNITPSNYCLWCCDFSECSYEILTTMSCDTKDTNLFVYTCLCIMWHQWHSLWCVCVYSMLALRNLCQVLIPNQIRLGNKIIIIPTSPPVPPFFADQICSILQHTNTRKSAGLLKQQLGKQITCCLSVCAGVSGPRGVCRGNPWAEHLSFETVYGDKASALTLPVGSDWPRPLSLIWSD